MKRLVFVVMLTVVAIAGVQVAATARDSGHSASAVALATPAAATSATGEWTWMGGSNTVDHIGVYGTPLVPAAGNVPGSRLGASTWTDSNGNLWLFGGMGYDQSGIVGALNDLWEFNPSTNEWAFILGSESANEAGVYGTLGAPGTGGLPGGRYLAVSWTDGGGNLWLFGGYGYDSTGTWGYLNDLWELNPNTLSGWAWMGGSTTANQAGVYGFQGTPAIGNIPGSRHSANSWTDKGGNLWLFGGWGCDHSGTSGLLNDLWVFYPATNEWAFMLGGNSANPAGVYATLGEHGLPGGRETATSWADSSGNFWLFGGNGIDSNGTEGRLNDLWEINPTPGNGWVWMGGSSTVPG